MNISLNALLASFKYLMNKTAIGTLPPLVPSNQPVLDYRAHSRKKMETIAERPPLRPVLGQSGNSRGAPKRRENAIGPDPLQCINKIIDDCEEAAQDYGACGEAKKRESHSQVTRNSFTSTGSEDKVSARANSQNRSRINYKAEAENFKSRRLSSNSCLGVKKSIKLTGEIQGITNDQLKSLYEAKCKDLKRKATKEQQRRFMEYCSKVIQSRKLVLNEV